MRYTAGKLADGLHLLSLGKLNLKIFLFGGVDDVNNKFG